VTLVVATPLLALATARNLERLGISQARLQSISLPQRLEALRAATGRLITPIRKRYGVPPIPTLDLATVDTSLFTGNAVASWSGGPATLVQDSALTFAASGATYTLTQNYGSFGATAGPSQAWSGSLTVDGYTLTLTGSINTGDIFAWTTSMVQDPGIALAVAQVGAWLLLHNTGLDPGTEQDLQRSYESAIEWAKALGIPGEGQLDASLDLSTVDGGTYGPLGTGQSSPYAWIDDPSYPDSTLVPNT
jgi:hypothetical protein